MTSTRWQEIERVYHAAVELPTAERHEFLRKFCENDSELRREVESLLADDSSKAGNLDQPAWVGLDELTALDATVTVMNPGTRLGPYRIVGPLGKGGMGEVFRAEDTRLGRPVAIKMSHEKFSDRFEREARAISSLNHPHICTLYDVGPNYLVMELCEGETLAARLERGKLSSAETIRYGSQIAGALATAHAKGIIHRDLKPGNVMLTKAGVKVLDFGLAKSQDDETLTAAGLVMGTPAYMAPEQREGKECDTRADIYSLGLVLYEMATAKRSNEANKPSMDAFPPMLAHIIERCVAPDPDDRWQSARDVQLELSWVGTSLSAAPSPRRPSSFRWVSIGVALTAAILSGFAFRAYLKPEPPERTIRFNLTEKDAGIKITGLPLPAPDGSAVVYPAADSKGQHLLWLRSLDSEQGKPLAGTEDAVNPFWSPDGRWIGFHSQGKLKKISRDGASIQTIASLSGFDSAAWGGNGDILLTLGNRTPIFRVADSGGVPQQLTKLDESRTENSHRGITFLPDGRNFFFVARCNNRENNALYKGSLDSGEIRRVAHMESNVAYVPPRNGRGAMLLFANDGKLFQQAFDGSQLQGEPVSLMDVQYSATGILGDFALSANGTVLVIRPRFESDARLTWINRSGNPTGTLGLPGVYAQPVIAPDGSRVVFNKPDDNGGNRDVWSIETGRGITSRLTLTRENEWNTVWAPDGKSIIFASDRSGNQVGSTFQKSSMEPGSEETALANLPEFANPDDWSSDGRWIAFGHGGTHGTIWIAPTFGDKKPFRFLETPFEEREPRFSPDGKWIAYHSNESGRFEVYVRPFLGMPAASGGKVRISERGGFWPIWSRNAKELFFIGPDSKVYVADVAGLGSTGTVSSPKALFEVCPGNTPTPSLGRNFDLSRQGDKFLFVCGNEAEGHYSVFANWKPQ